MSRKSVSDMDVYVGQRIKFRRLLLGMTQVDLAKLLGVTFQQVQKYEKGINRVSAGRLFVTAEILAVPVSFFYEEGPLNGPKTPDANMPIAKLQGTDELFELSKAFLSIKAPRVRHCLLDLVQLLAKREVLLEALPA